MDDGSSDYLLGWDEKLCRAVYVKRDGEDSRKDSMPTFTAGSPEIPSPIIPKDEGTSHRLYRSQSQRTRAAVISLSPKGPALAVAPIDSPPLRPKAICGDYDSDFWELSPPPTKGRASDRKETEGAADRPAEASIGENENQTEKLRDQEAEVNSVFKIPEISHTFPMPVTKSVCRGLDSESEVDESEVENGPSLRTTNTSNREGRRVSKSFGREASKSFLSGAADADGSAPNSILVDSSRPSAATPLAAAAAYFRALDRGRLAIAPASPTTSHVPGFPPVRTARIIRLNNADVVAEYEDYVRASAVPPLSSEEYAAGLGVHFGDTGRCPDTLLDRCQP